MELNLERPLLFFDIESTGLNIATDSIIELSFVKIMPGNEQRVKTWRLMPFDYEHNCQKHISQEAHEINKISDADLKDCPKFYEVIGEVADWLKDCDLAGYNSTKFDLPMLAEEIERARLYKKINVDVNLHEKKMVDVQIIYFTMEPRNLKAAYRFYCGGRDFDNAHSAEADTLATYEVLKGQLDKYGDTLKNDVDSLSKVGMEARKLHPRTLDFAGRIALSSKDEPIISFGKHRGKTAREVYNSEPSYFAWIENGEFSLDTKRQFALLKEKYEAEKRLIKMKASAPLNEEETLDAGKRLAEKFGSGKPGNLF